MNYKMTGTIVMIGEKNQVSDKFAKRDIVLSDDADKYPQEVSFQFTQDKCDLLDSFGEGQEVEVSYNLSGRSFGLILKQMLNNVSILLADGKLKQ
jgi:hypothetical protein